MKVSTHVTVDAIKKRKLKSLGYVLSEIVDEAITNKINFHNLDPEAINIEQTKIELELLEKKQSKINEKVSKLREKVSKYEKKQLENEKKRLEDEQKAIINAKKCIECGIVINKNNDKYHCFNKGIVCNGCFMTAVDIKKWY